MKRWDHMDVVVAVGMCATILGAGIFFFSSGGAPYGLFATPSVEATLDPQGIAQDVMGRAIVQNGRLRYFTESNWSTGQESLGSALLAGFQSREAQATLIPRFQMEAQQSFARMQGLIQERAGRSLVLAAQRVWRAGNTEAAQLQFIDALGRTQEGMILQEEAAIPLREEALGWNIVGGNLAMDRYLGQVQESLGGALRDSTMMASRIGTETPLAQEALGGAVLVVARTTEGSRDASDVQAVAFAGAVGTREVPYQAGIILLAAIFVGAWGVWSLTQSGASISTAERSVSLEDQYRKTG